MFPNWSSTSSPAAKPTPWATWPGGSGAHTSCVAVGSATTITFDEVTEVTPVAVDSIW